MSEKLEVGSIVEGKVLRIKPFGAIVSLGSMQGLVHISQVSSQFIEDINDHVKVNDMVKVKILSIDEENRKIALSMKDALPKKEKVERIEQKERTYQKSNTTQNKTTTEQNRLPISGGSSADFEDKMKDWFKQSSERQTTLNKRANKRSY